jgi:hypothetical protein
MRARTHSCCVVSKQRLIPSCAVLNCFLGYVVRICESELCVIRLSCCILCNLKLFKFCLCGMSYVASAVLID